MSIILPGLFALLLFSIAGYLFVRLDARQLAAAARNAGPFALGLLGVVMIVVGRAGLGGMCLAAALAWFGSARASRTRGAPAPGRKAMVRTAALEMELDHDSGRLEGHVLAGRFEGKSLSMLSLEQVLDLYRELASDSESLQLLEAYLDGQFPVWRQHAQADVGGRQGVAPGTGPMTKEEAYKVLGLEAGASAADVRKAHRRLMQRLHPDLGGSSFLAARINEAKDVLLSSHD